MNKPNSYTLKNNLPITFIPDTSVTYISIAFKVRAGSNYEDAGQLGMAHLTEHLILSKNNELLQQYGGKAWGITSRDECLIYIKVLKEYFEQALNYLHTVLLEKNYTEQELGIQKDIVIQEIKRSLSNPEKAILRRSYATVYPNTRMETLNTGEILDVQKISLDELLEFKQRHYNAQNSSFTVTGNLPNTEVKTLTTKYLGKLLKGTKTKNPVIKVDTEYKRKAVTQIIEFGQRAREARQVHVKIDFYGVTSGDNKKYALDYLAYILESYLVQVLKKEQGSAYVVNVKNISSTNYGVFSIYTATNDENIIQKISTVIDDVEQVLQNLDLELISRCMVSECVFNLEKPSQVAEFYSTALLEGDASTVESEITSYKNIKLNDILDAYKYIVEQNPKVTVLE